MDSNANWEYKPWKIGRDRIFDNPHPLSAQVITEPKYNKAWLCKTSGWKQMFNDWFTEKRLEGSGLNEE